MLPKQKSSLKTGEQRQTSVTFQKSVTVPIKLEKSRQREGNSYSSSLLLAKFQDYALHASEPEISEAEIPT